MAGTSSVLLAVNVLLTTGVLWKLLALARWCGRYEEKVDSHSTRLDRIEGQLQFPAGGRVKSP